MTYSSEVLADSPWGFWEQAETSGTNLNDSSPNNRDLTITGTPTLNQAGPFTPAAAVAWPESVSAERYASATTVNTSVITLEAWVYLTATPTNPTPIIATAASYASNTQRIAFFVDATGKLNWMTYQGGATAVLITAPSALSLNAWHHVVASIGAAGSKVRVDKTTVVTGAGTAISAGAETVFVHGGGSDSSDAGRRFANGSPITIALPAVYTTQLSDARTDAHYDAPGPFVTLSGVVPQPVGSFTLETEQDVTLAGVVPQPVGTFDVTVGNPSLVLSGVVPQPTGSFALETEQDVSLAGVVPQPVGSFALGGGPLDVSLAGVVPQPTARFTLTNPMGTNEGDGNGDDGDAYAVVTWDPPVVEPPVPFVFRDEIAAHAYTGVDTTGRPGFIGHTTKTRTRRWTRILVAGRDVTFLNGIATPEPTYSLISPLLYGSGSISFPQYPAFLYGTAAIPAWIKPGAPVVVQRINEALEVTGISYRGFLLDVNINGRDLSFGLGGEASGRAALVDQPPRIFRKRNSLEFWWEGLIRDLHLPVGNSATTGVVLQNRGGMDMLTYANELSANGAKRGGAVYTCMPNMDGEYRVVQKDKTTIDGTCYFDDAHTKPDLRRDPAEEPNRIYATAVSPSGRRIRFADYPVLAEQKPLPYPMDDGSAFGIGTTDADTDSGGGVTAMLARLVWTGYLDPDDRPGGFDSDVADALEELQDEARLAQTGNMNENTWNALYDIGISGPSIGGAQVRAAVQRAKVRRYNRTGSGQVLGPNPDYDPTVLPVDATKDYGTGHTKNQVKNFARADLHEAEASNWVGSIVFATGGLILGEHTPGTAIGTVMDARQLKPGMNVWAPLFDGGTLFHVSGCEVGQTSDGRSLVTAQVDTRFRDTMAVNEIIDRNRESRRNPARDWTRNYRSSGKVNDVVSEWDDVGGFLPGDVQLQGGRWNKIGMIAGQEGTISSLRIRLADEECESVVGVFGRDIEEEKLNRRIGNPLSPDGRAQWQDQGILEDLDDKHFLLYVAGSDEQPCGYWPKTKTDAGAGLTGIHKDDAGFRYFAFDDCSVWLMIYPAQDCTLLGGRLMRNQLESGS